MITELNRWFPPSSLWWAELCTYLYNSFAKILAPRISECDCLEIWSLERWLCYNEGFRMGPLQFYRSPVKKRFDHRVGHQECACARTAHVNTARRWPHTSQRERLGKIVPLCPPEDTGPAIILILDFQVPKLWENTFLLLRPTFCGPLLWQSWGANMLASGSVEYSTVQ